MNRVAVFGFAAVVALVSVAGLAQDEAQAKKDEKKPAATQPVDYKKLKEAMPEKLADLKRSELGGERIKTGDFAMSNARATYRGGEADDAPSFEVQAIDYGAAPGMAEGFKAMTAVEVDQESDDQIQKSVKVDGQPGMETYQKKDKSGQVQLYVAGRFLVTLEARNVTQEQLEKAMNELPLKKLTGLK